MRQEKVDYLPTLKELIMVKDFPDEVMCVQLVAQKLWGREPECPQCKMGKLRIQSMNGSWQLSCNRNSKGCYYHVGVLTGTMFMRSRVTLDKWFLAIDLIYRTEGHITGAMLAKKLDISTANATVMRRKIIAYLDLGPKVGLQNTQTALN